MLKLKKNYLYVLCITIRHLYIIFDVIMTVEQTQSLLHGILQLK